MKIAINNNLQITAEANKGQQLSKNFTLEELANNAGDPTKPQYLVTSESIMFVSILQTFRNIVAAPVIINSGYRQPEYNKKIGGDSRSAHTHGCAVDVQPIKGLSTTSVIESWLTACAAYGVIGAVNIYPDHAYYHLEAFSDKWYEASQNTIRVYSTDSEYRALAANYKKYPITVLRCK